MSDLSDDDLFDDEESFVEAVANLDELSLSGISQPQAQTKSPPVKKQCLGVQEWAGSTKLRYLSRVNQEIQTKLANLDKSSASGISQPQDQGKAKAPAAPPVQSQGLGPRRSRICWCEAIT